MGDAAGEQPTTSVASATAAAESSDSNAEKSASVVELVSSSGTSGGLQDGARGGGRRARAPRHAISSTNVYIRGLPPDFSSDNLRALCDRYGRIVSAKAIVDPTSFACRGYGFVEFCEASSALSALNDLNAQDNKLEAEMAKDVRPRLSKQHEQDPTNLYIANLPPNFTDATLRMMLDPFGLVISTRILSNNDGSSRCVGFARLTNKEACERAIEYYNNRLLGSAPLIVKLADSGTRRPKPSTSRQSSERATYSSFQSTQASGGGGGGVEVGYPQPLLSSECYPIMSPPIETIDAYASAAGGLAYSNVAVAAAYPHSNFASSTYDFYAQSPDFVTQAPSQQLVYQQQPAAAAAFQLPSTLYKPTASLDDGGYFYPAVYSIYQNVYEPGGSQYFYYAAAPQPPPPSSSSMPFASSLPIESAAAISYAPIVAGDEQHFSSAAAATDALCNQLAQTSLRPSASDGGGGDAATLADR